MIDAGTKRLLDALNPHREVEFGGIETMRKLGLAAVAGRERCGDRLRHIRTRTATTIRYYGNNGYYNSATTTRGRRAATGAAVGAAGGAVAGAVIPGVSPVAGRGRRRGPRRRPRASVKGRQYYRDTRGYCYYVDQYGRPHYDYNIAASAALAGSDC